MTKNKLKSLFFLLLSTAVFVFGFSGCLKSYELKERVLIQAIGIDKSDGLYKFSLQSFIAEETGGRTGIDSSKSNTKIITVYGKTISEALDNVALVQGKTAFYGQNKYIAIGREAAKEDISRILAFFNSNNQARAGTDIIMADGEAAEIIELKLVENITSSLSVRHMLENGLVNGKIFRATLLDMDTAAESSISSLAMPVITPVKAENEIDNTLYASGTALFKDGKYVAEINPILTRGLLWATRDIDSSIVAYIDSGDVDIAAVEVDKLSIDIDAQIVDGIPHFKFYLRANGSLTELLLKDNKTAHAEDIHNIETYVAEMIAQEMEEAFDVIVRQHRCDVFRLYEWLKKNEKEFWQQNSGNWEQLMALSTCDAEAALTIKRFDLKN
ncbi:MAG: Ger(x)C family spore germination protein [Oscillospiraceae bacterium]|nr:Ger(x)C family spore germination protein [Oscillospiraceae bacterium]